MSEREQKEEPLRIVTATSLFDGHDAAINIMRRILQQQGAEVIHLGHDRSVEAIAKAAVEEDADAIAISSYQGGHDEFFRYLIAELAERGGSHIRVYGGGGGTITKQEVRALEGAGVARIFRPEDGRRLGLEGMIGQIISESRAAKERGEGAPRLEASEAERRLSVDDPLAITQLISCFEREPEELMETRERLRARAEKANAPLVGVTGTGGAGKSSLVDEMVRRFRADLPDARIGLLLVDPTRRSSGGALLGDRIRMNAVDSANVFVRSLGTRRAHLALSRAVDDAALVLRAAGFDLVLVETAGIGQSDSEVVDLAETSVYVMTPDYGAPSQLEKIDMLELASLVVLNKFDRRGAEDALRDVRKQWRRNRRAFELPEGEVPVLPAIASRWNDPSTEAVYQRLRALLVDAGYAGFDVPSSQTPGPSEERPLRPRTSSYLAEVAETVRGYHRRSGEAERIASDACALQRTLALLGDALPDEGSRYSESDLGEPSDEEHAEAVSLLRARYDATLDRLDPVNQGAIWRFTKTREAYAAARQSYEVRGRRIEVENKVATLAGSPLPKVAFPRIDDWGARLRYLHRENVPGSFPFTGGVFPFRRAGETPARMFAGEGGPEATNRRFHLLAAHQPSARLSTAFDSVTLYGRDPDPRPDILGKVGNSGVSVATIDDAKKLYSGFDLSAPSTSVSMTINGPAPMVLAFFLNAAIDQQVERHLIDAGKLDEVRARFAARGLPRYEGELPEGHNGLGLGLLGISGDEAVDAETYARIRREVLRRVRGTVQADILKEDQAQNTCIFSTEFGLKMMGDIQSSFIEWGVTNFYSVSISGYHMAEAGANPITQLAFTLANGFTYCESYLARGLDVDAFTPNFSFFFSNGLDAEYAVLGRVARRIWAVAMRERYGAGERSQKLKYHVQTSGRSLHAEEMAFNDIRTTLQALSALTDNCNSLHTNAYDEAVTTPTEESVRRALAIQLIIDQELGMGKSENALSGSYVIEELTDLVEEAVLREFDRLSDRGGVLGAMETLYQRGKIQEESMHYESLKHAGALPIVGVNTFLAPHEEPRGAERELRRSSEAQKQTQLSNLRAFHERHADAAPGALSRLEDVALRGGNVFEELMETVKAASLGEITEALFRVGGRYRRSV